MGRRGVRVDDEERWVFNRLAEAYQHRPAYPEPLIGRLVELAGGRGARVADIGAGTGLVALPLARQGLLVDAVEPAREMLRVLEANAQREPLGVDLHHRAAEATDLPSGVFDLVVLADTVQWVDPELAALEAARLLRRGGVLAVVETSLGDSPLMRALAAMLQGLNPRARGRAAGRAEQLIAKALGARATTDCFEQRVPLSQEAFEGVMRSLSYAGPAFGEAQIQSMLSEAQRLATAHGGAVWHRLLCLRHAKRR